MKKLVGGIKKNIFYISLITGMAVLVTVLGLYNAKNNSKEKNIVIGQNEPAGDTSELDRDADQTNKTRETLSGKTQQEEKTDTKDIDTEESVYEVSVPGSSEEAVKELHYDPEESINWPVVGNVIIPYSMDTTVYFETLKEYKCSPAIVLEAQVGEEVKAVYDCKVAEVSSSPELGNYVKLDMGDGYMVTLGQLQEVKAALGDVLETGQVVGTVGEPSRFYSEEGTNLYFAIEKDGKPVDPMLLID